MNELIIILLFMGLVVGVMPPWNEPTYHGPFQFFVRRGASALISNILMWGAMLVQFRNYRMYKVSGGGTQSGGALTRGNTS